MTKPSKGIWLAPLRGVTVRTFRAVFGDAMIEAGFDGAFAPFIPANAGFRFSKRLFSDVLPDEASSGLEVVPQVIGKDPRALRDWCKAVKDLGYRRADLNAGCPFPMIRKKGRGSGLMRTPDVLDMMLEAGCDEMGIGGFSLKTRLGVERSDEILNLMPIINRYPLAALTVHARTAKQMYEGGVDLDAFRAVASVAEVPLIYNGDASVGDSLGDGLMVGRRFISGLALRDDALSLLARYVEASRAELSGDAPVLGRMKELLSYWCREKSWQKLWPVIKICRSVDEIASVLNLHL